MNKALTGDSMYLPPSPEVHVSTQDGAQLQNVTTTFIKPTRDVCIYFQLFKIEIRCIFYAEFLQLENGTLMG